MDQGDFFFSYFWDLTTSMQNQVPLLNIQEFSSITAKYLKEERNNNNIRNNSVFLSYNDRFVWNTHILQPLLNGTDNFGLILPIINGSFCQKNIEIEEKLVSLAIISRRSRFNAGARYLKRGINSFGDVANEVETEQILLENNPFDNTHFKISSFLHVNKYFSLIRDFLKESIFYRNS